MEQNRKPRYKFMQLQLFDFLIKEPPKHTGEKTVSSRNGARPLMNGLRKCGIYTQWNFTQP
jgi:hypothetical protein